MSGIRRDTITNPYLNEYVYDVAINLTKEQRSRLNIRYAKALRNSKTAKSFVTKSTIEEKIILLGKLGIPFGFYFNLSKQKLNALFEKHGDKKEGLTNSLLEEKIIVVSDREIMQFLGLMASNCHSETWLMNREFFTAGHKLTGFKKSYANPTNSAVKETIQCAKEVLKNSMDTALAFEYCVEYSGITKNAMLILIFLFLKSSYHIEEELIKLEFKNILTNEKIGQAMYLLQNNQCIEKSADSSVRRRKFIITGIGRDTVLKFQKKIFNLSNF